MNSLIAGAKAPFISSVLAALALVSVFYSHQYWLPWQHYFFISFQIISVLVVLFSLQFNHSRFALLILYLLFYQTLQTTSIDAITLWQDNGTWQLLSSVSFIGYLAWVKDRGLLSIHIIMRVLALALCITGAYFWLEMAAYLQLTYSEIEIFAHNQWVSVYCPLIVIAISLLLSCFFSTSLFQPAALVTFGLWVSDYFALLPMSWLVVSLVLVAYYFISVVASSYFLAYRDELTGLPSRRALFQLSLSLSKKYAVAMMDIDHFKKFNDTYGHDVGDQVLKLVATKLSKVKSGGKVFRYGGEEFTVIFPRKYAEATIAELETLRQSIADYKMVIRQTDRKHQSKDNRKSSAKKANNSVSVTISIGVASAQPKMTFEQVMKEADKKLYKAKKNGRNNVCS